MDAAKLVPIVQLVHEQHRHIEHPGRIRRDGCPAEPFSDTEVDAEDEKDLEGTRSM